MVRISVGIMLTTIFFIHLRSAKWSLWVLTPICHRNAAFRPPRLNLGYSYIAVTSDLHIRHLHTWLHAHVYAGQAPARIPRAYTATHTQRVDTYAYPLNARTGGRE